jgi:lysyl-tRNA synthetase class 1
VDASASEGAFFDASFQLLLTFLQMPHVDVALELEKRKGSPLTAVEKKHLERRIHAARYWIDRVATDEERIRLQDTLPARAAELSAAQRGFLHRLADAIQGEAWSEDALQAKVFDTARRAPVAQSVAFQAIYRVFLDKVQGPPAGALMAVLPREMVLARLRELPADDAAFWRETASSPSAIRAALEKEKAKIVNVTSVSVGPDRAEVVVTHLDGKVFVHRLLGPDAAAAASFP